MVTAWNGDLRTGMDWGSKFHCMFVVNIWHLTNMNPVESRLALWVLTLSALIITNLITLKPSAWIIRAVKNFSRENKGRKLFDLKFGHRCFKWYHVKGVGRVPGFKLWRISLSVWLIEEIKNVILPKSLWKILFLAEVKITVKITVLMMISSISRTFKLIFHNLNPGTPTTSTNANYVIKVTGKMLK